MHNERSKKLGKTVSLILCYLCAITPTPLRGLIRVCRTANWPKHGRTTGLQRGIMSFEQPGLSYDLDSDNFRIETQYSLPNGDISEQQRELQDSGYCG